jgi:hypothetical protein
MIPIKRTARQRLETFANISRLKPDEETYDLERSVVGSVVAGTTADRCGQCGACDRTVVPVDVGNREDDNVVMMPPLPPHSWTIDAVRLWDKDAVLAYGRAVAEACAVKCETISDRHLSSGRYCSVIGDHSVRAGGQADGASECAAAIREMAKAISAKP